MELFMYCESENSCSKLQITIHFSHPKRQIHVVVYLTKDIEKNKSSVDCNVLSVSTKHRVKTESQQFKGLNFILTLGLQAQEMHRLSTNNQPLTNSLVFDSLLANTSRASCHLRDSRDICL